MGNTIIRVSHVGTVQHQVGKYTSPPSEETLAATKRAAVLTRQRWKEEEELKKAKDKARLAKKKRAQKRKRAAERKRQAYKDRTASTVNAPKTTDIPNQKPKQPSKAHATAAQKLGISESELGRRLDALRKFHSSKQNSNESVAPRSLYATTSAS